MNRSLHHLLGALLLGLAAAAAGCVLPPSFLERDSLAPAGEDWAEQGRFRRAPAPQQPAPPLESSPGLATGSLENPLEQPTAATPRPPAPVSDTGVVEGPPLGRVLTQDGAPRGVEVPSGRTHIVELYQRVVDERDALSIRAENLRKELEKTGVALDLARKETAELTARVGALEQGQEALRAENQDLSGRLLQAQIRRLEAEKLLLENRLEQERIAAAERTREATSPRTGKARE